MIVLLLSLLLAGPLSRYIEQIVVLKMLALIICAIMAEITIAIIVDETQYCTSYLVTKL